MSFETLQDEQIPCCDCLEFFVWTCGQQRYFRDKGLHPPKRCPACRQKKREAKEKQNAEQATNA
jgi:hypothetical protein